MTGRQELNVALGNSLTEEDAYPNRTFDFVGEVVEVMTLLRSALLF